jgi:exodeoxyribonuclease VII large subunit
VTGSNGGELTVAQLSNLVARALGQLPRGVCVRGQLADLGKGYRGHIFASLRSEGASIRCFVHARIVGGMPAALAEGDTVVLRGRVSWYRARGDIQLIAESITLVDESTRAREAVARLQAALEREGTLQTNRSLRMPGLPRRVAVVGGHCSAAVLDIVTALHRRSPWIAVDVHTTRLQGDGAHLEIASAISSASASGAEVVAVVRGGGASGDFAPFDSVEVCRAIARCRAPVVTALGHEQDRRLADLAAHTAASTPSDAAQHIVPEASRLTVVIADARRRMADALSGKLRGAAGTQAAAAMRLCTSAQLLTTRTRARAGRITLGEHLHRVAAAVSIRHRGLRTASCRGAELIARRISDGRSALRRTRTRNVSTVHTRADAIRASLEMLRHRIRVAHPHNVLARGFVIARDEAETVITVAEAAAAAGTLRLEFNDGTIVVHVSATPNP